MDISNLKPVERVVDILHPGNGEEIGLKVKMISTKDVKLNKFRREMQNERLNLERRGKKIDALFVEEHEDISLFNVLTGWIWAKDADFHGEKLEFNEKNFKAVIKELPWIKTQIQEAVTDESAFFPS